MPEDKKLHRLPGDHRTVKERNQYLFGYEAGEKAGERAGVDKVRKMVLDYLQAQYMTKEVGRGTPKGDAILEVTRNLSEALRQAGF